MNFDPHIELSCTDESYTLYRDALTEVDRGSVLKVGTRNDDSRSLTCGNGSRAAAGNNGCRSTSRPFQPVPKLPQLTMKHWTGALL